MFNEFIVNKVYANILQYRMILTLHSITRMTKVNAYIKETVLPNSQHSIEHHRKEVHNITVAQLNGK